jgi:hypothetical protein
MPEYGFLYATYNDITKLFLMIPSSHNSFCHAQLSTKFMKAYHILTHQNNNIIIGQYDLCCKHPRSQCKTIHRWLYECYDNSYINKFIKENPDIKHDKWNDILDMENDYDDRSNFFKDYFDRLLNMGISNPTICHKL